MGLGPAQLGVEGVQEEMKQIAIDTTLLCCHQPWDIGDALYDRLNRSPGDAFRALLPETAALPTERGGAGGGRTPCWPTNALAQAGRQGTAMACPSPPAMCTILQIGTAAGVAKGAPARLSRAGGARGGVVGVQLRERWH